ncbi:MAG TPA: hypothetical protein PLR32_10675, partial [candidate division Zixibacteria bacterium]|nr:hypothetical protein [candidate division Zixibacteria bacterium]
MIKRLAMLAAAALALGGPGAGAQDGLALMKVEPGARPAGMGGAFAAMLGSADAVPYNPAAGHVAEALAVSLGHVSYWERIRLESGFLTALVRPKLSVHAAVRYASVDDLERRTAPTTEPEGRFDAQDMSLKAGAAYEATERVTVGASFGWFMEKIDQANGW